jgi:hypothetical protein
MVGALSCSGCPEDGLAAVGEVGSGRHARRLSIYGYNSGNVHIQGGNKIKHKIYKYC